MGDVASLGLISAVAADMKNVTADAMHELGNQFAHDRHSVGSRFGAKIMSGSLPRLWLKISLLAVAYNRVDKVVVFQGIGLSFYAILMVLPSFFLYVREQWVTHYKPWIRCLCTLTLLV